MGAACWGRLRDGCAPRARPPLICHCTGLGGPSSRPAPLLFVLLTSAGNAACAPPIVPPAILPSTPSIKCCNYRCGDLMQAMTSPAPYASSDSTPLLASVKSDSTPMRSGSRSGHMRSEIAEKGGHVDPRQLISLKLGKSSPMLSGYQSSSSPPESTRPARRGNAGDSAGRALRAF